MVIVYPWSWFASLIASLSFWGVAAYTKYADMRAFIFNMKLQVSNDRDVRFWKRIMGNSSHPLQDLFLPLKNRALRGRSHPY